MSNLKKIIIKYAVAVGISTALALISLEYAGYNSELAMIDKYRLLSNAFTIPGLLLLMVGCLIAVSTSGLFDMLSYGFQRALRAFIPGHKAGSESFYDYKTRKSEVRFSGYSFVLITGAVFTAISVIFLILFYSVY